MIIAGYPAIGKTTYASERTDVLDMSLVLNFVGKDLMHVDPEYARKNADAIVEKQKKFHEKKPQSRSSEASFMSWESRVAAVVFDRF